MEAMSRNTTARTTPFAATRLVAGDEMAKRIEAAPSDQIPETVAELFPDAPGWLVSLAELEQGLREVEAWLADNELPRSDQLQDPQINPGLQIQDASWQGVARFRRELLDRGEAPDEPMPGREYLLLWPTRTSGARCRPADNDDLLALKIVGDSLTVDAVAAETGAQPASLTRLLVQAHWEELVILPHSKLVRPWTDLQGAGEAPLFPEAVYSSRAFVLQWHITQRCDLNCKHCYDRTEREDVSLEDGYGLLDAMARFCVDRQVVGQVSFSGGNPLLHPHFFDFYGRAVERGLNVAILGNPCPAETLDRLCRIEPPVFYQVSLEGLEEQNNAIRGPGHFERTLAFLKLLEARCIYSQVMLTLTAANQAQVIPLGKFLAGRTDSFTFNRLAPVGQGASLACAPTSDYPAFLRDYLDAARDNPHMSLKDSLFNILLRDEGRPGFGGCTGSGCGAAYNFLSVLGDGTAHACRKMDSPVGNVHASGLAAVYDSPAAERYRTGSEPCRDCALRPGCGGCMAVVKGLGFDPLKERDPYCPLDHQ